jgi:hypothetical protein
VATVPERVKLFHTGDFFDNHKCKALIITQGSITSSQADGRFKV